MNVKIMKSSILRTLNGEYYNFYLNQNNKLMMDKFNSLNSLMSTSLVANEYILDFSAFIDEKDKVHLIYLLKDGNLIYSIYFNDKWSESLVGKFNLKSNIYNNLSIYIIENVIYIFYAYANLINKKIWTMEVIIGNKTNWTKKRITTILSENSFNSFRVDYDKIGNIHFVYTSREGEINQVYYTFYNTYMRNWNQIPFQISDSNTSNLFPYLFVDSKDNIHILWYTLKNKDYELQYKKLSPNGKDKYKWRSINLPSIKNCTFTPIMFESKDTLKIVYLKNKTINSLYSLDNGESWNINDKINLHSENFHFSNYISNFGKDYFLGKSNNFYCKINNEILFYFKDNHDDNLKIEMETSESLHENIENKNNEGIEKFPETKETDDLTKLKESMTEMSNTIKEIQISIDNMEDDILTLKKTIKKKDDVNFLEKLLAFFK
ncbi:hypothetical protein [Sporanaerobacter acetigenes]|uniref:BNR repeat-containing family member n=1 Tax=Sporanaerobacter acetigenes DSM 13106 TaxID=1123281 RepID=A0A1M5UE56_9FIRM|nr:hypothetical protein [Sporanaerobacter acetigenes]SHH61188.1 hypothetical protein SAMN02745180_00610 [Sporanaerobacter acetigenes DSM 13106]